MKMIKCRKCRIYLFDDEIYKRKSIIGEKRRGYYCRLCVEREIKKIFGEFLKKLDTEKEKYYIEKFINKRFVKVPNRNSVKVSCCGGWCKNAKSGILFYT